MERAKWYWNNRWGRLARHDLILYSDGTIELRQGGEEGWRKWWRDLTPDQAEERIRQVMAQFAGEWRDMLVEQEWNP